MSEYQIAQAGIGRKFQKPTVFEALTVFENLELALKTDKSVWASLAARLSGEQRQRIEEVLSTLRLLPLAQRQAGCCPTGRSSSWRSACCWCRSRSCCCWTNRWRA
jgi:urea transport system ATP-binding protein